MGEAKRRKQTGAPSPARKNNKKPLLIAGALVVVAAVAAALYFLTTPPAPSSDALPVAAPNADEFPAIVDQYGISVGSEDAPVVVREFADYQCPACARFAEASQRLKQEYVETGKVRFVYFDLPLRQHQNAMPAAQAARANGPIGANAARGSGSSSAGSSLSPSPRSLGSAPRQKSRLDRASSPTRLLPFPPPAATVASFSGRPRAAS